MFTNEIIYGMRKQSKNFQDEEIKDLIVCIELINGDTYPLCFIVNETEQYLNIVKTSLNSGKEKVIVLNKEAILKISVVYADDVSVNNEKVESKDCMFN